MAGSINSQSKCSELFVGQVFKTYQEFENALREYGRENHTLFVKENCKKSKFVDHEYDFVALVCKQGGRQRKSTSKGIRANLGHSATGCEASFVLSYDYYLKVLRLTKVNMVHNHPTTPETYAQEYQVKRLGPHEKHSLKEIVELNPRNESLLAIVNSKFGKTYTLTEIRHLKHQLTSGSSNGNSMVEPMNSWEDLQENGQVKFAISNNGSDNLLDLVAFATTPMHSNRLSNVGAPFMIRASWSPSPCPANGNFFYRLSKVILEHNHQVSEDTYKAYTENRRPHMTESLQSLLACKSVSNLDIRLHIEQTQGKTLLSSDLRNLKLKQNINKAKTKTKTTDVNQVKQFVDSFVAGGGYIDYDLNENEGSFNYLVYMSHSMKMLVSQFPEVLIIDVTYESNWRLPPLLTAMCIDNAGGVHPVLHAFVRYDGENLLGKCLEFFSERYESTSTKTIFVGKEITEVATIKTVFPYTDVLLYRSNIKQAVRNFLQEKLVPTDLIKVVPSLFEKQTLAVTEEEYLQLEAEIKSLVSTSVAEYFESNWWNCRELWAAYLNLDTPELHVSTTNHIESYNRRVKSVLCSKLCLGEALELLTKYDNHLLQDAATRTAVDAMKCHYNSKDNDSVVDEIYNDVTSFASKLVVAQYKLAKNFDYSVSIISDDKYEIKSSGDLCNSTSLDSCSCKFFINYKLQCRHMFALRHHLNLSLYQKVPEQHRFSRKLLVPLLSSQRKLFSVSGVDKNNSNVSVQDKFATAEKLMKDFSSYLCLLDDQTFRRKTEQLQMLLRHWKNNEEVQFQFQSSDPYISGPSIKTEYLSGLGLSSGVEPRPSTSTDESTVSETLHNSGLAVGELSASNLVDSPDFPACSEENMKNACRLGTSKLLKVKIQKRPLVTQKGGSIKRKKSIPQACAEIDLETF